MSGRMTTLPHSSSTSSSLDSSIAAWMPTYSALCMPAEISTVDPGRLPQSSTWGTCSSVPSTWI